MPASSATSLPATPKSPVATPAPAPVSFANGTPSPDADARPRPVIPVPVLPSVDPRVRSYVAPVTRTNRR
jgi:hypothetical protein